ncbi:MAG: toll/interleukin-1 receptor domain-containing protein [Rubrivivax sp.]
MPPRIFISYRSADGADKATALARDLGLRFGPDQVFLDKDDLPAGSRWTREVGRTLRSRPVLLLIITPLAFAATGTDGRRRIDDVDDPLRREVAAADAAGATIIPLLADGVDALPPASALPPPLDRLGDRTWRRLRAYDWTDDVERLVADLRGLGLVPRPARLRRRRLALLGALVAGLALVFGARWRAGGDGSEPSGDRSGDLSGTWDAVAGDDTMRLELQEGAEGRVRVESHPIDVRTRADWAEQRAFWLRRSGVALEAVRLRGEGVVRRAPGSPPALDVGFELLTLPAEQPVDGGNLSATRQPDGRWVGRRWLNGAQAETTLTLTRRR